VSLPDKMVAEVTAISHDCDLALLTVADEEFMDGVEPEPIGDLPTLRDRVSVVGFPVGGEEISVTEGVVSRIEVQRYSHSERMLLAVTVDAAINDGNSGGPAFMDGKVVGIAFQSLRDAENIGELVPATLIDRFLRGVEQGRPTHVPGLGLASQNLENPLLRSRAGLSGHQSGVLVLQVEHGGSADGRIREGDALLSIDGHRIANNGTVQYHGRFRTTFDVMLGNHYVGDEITVEVLRAGKIEELRIELKPYVRLVPRSQYDVPPSYFVYGGVVFQPLSLDFLRTWREWWEKAPPEFLHQYYAGVRSAARQEVVVATKVLADEINVGFEDLETACVATVNGVCPRDMGDFVRLVESATETVEIRTTDNCVMVFEGEQARALNPRILKRYRVAPDRSSNLRG
jgi:hypothetical protein